jgi:Fe-S oxidoreductase
VYKKKELNKKIMTALTQNNFDTIKVCRYCPMCRQSCPSEFISFRESDTPRGRAMLLQSVYIAEKEYNQSTIEAIYNCFVCGSCTSWCAGAEIGGYDIPELIKSARKDIVKKGMALDVVEKIKLSLLENNNPYNLLGSTSFTHSIVEKKADILYLLGEEINFKNHEIAIAAISIFDKLKLSFTLLKDEPTSGKIFDLLGYENESKLKAEELHKKIIASGCKTIIVSDPLEFDVLKNDYPKWGFHFTDGIKIYHLSEFIADIIQSGKIKLKATDEIVTLADSEFLGRFNKVFEAPRIVIQSSANNFKELRWNHEKMLSTGEAAFTFNDKNFTQGSNLGEKIIALANDVHAKKIITLSATAKNNIGNQLGIETLDIAEFVVELIS